MACDADLSFSQVTLAHGGGGGVLPTPFRALDFESALDFYTPTGASGTLKALGLHLIDSLAEEISFEEDHSVACELVFMDDEDFVTSVDEASRQAP